MWGPKQFEKGFVLYYASGKYIASRPGHSKLPAPYLIITPYLKLSMHAMLLAFYLALQHSIRNSYTPHITLYESMISHSGCSTVPTLGAKVEIR